MKRFFVFVLTSICLINLAFAQQMATIDPELYALMNSKSGGKISVNIILKEQVDVNEQSVRVSFSSGEDRRAYMVNEMKTQTENLQADVLKTLKANERSVQVTDIKCHWLTNVITCNATPDAILKIAEHPDVEAIIYNKKQKLLLDGNDEKTVATRAASADVVTSVEYVNAPQVWNMGFTGKDVIVAVIDTGVNTEHEDLKDHLWNDGNGHHGKNTLDDINFPDYTDEYDITDVDGHGTHCAGTICGDGTSGLITGVAPDATLMCIKALDNEGNGSLESILAGVEYALENNANVLSMSLGFSYPMHYVSQTLRNVFEQALDLGVVAAVAAGNDGAKLDEYQVPRNINAPGNCPPPWIHPDQKSNEGEKTSVVCVGAIREEDDALCSFSSVGPVTWQNTTYNDYKLGSGYPTKIIRYDNDDYEANLQGVSGDYGVMFEPSMLAEFANGGKLMSVFIGNGYTDNGYMYVYQGGATSPGTEKHIQSYQLDATGGMKEIVLNKDVQIDINQNLWVVFSSWTNPLIPVASNTDNANGRWVKKDGVWTNSAIDKMIKINVNISTSNVVEEEKIGLIRPDICAPGFQIKSTSADYPNYYYEIKNGTSQATPCVAGTIALLLEANPDLKPADICRVLETTAVKVEGATAKNNRTGSGRIDAYNAVLAVATDLPLSAPTLTATAKSSSQIDLSWTIAPGADSYTIYRNDSEIATGLTATSYSDTDLKPETKYSYEIKAIRGSESVKSSAVSATTLSKSAAIAGKYRIKVATSSNGTTGKYLHINSTAAPSGSTNVVVSAYTESDNQIFTIESADGGNYYLRSENGYYIKCDDQPNVNNRNTWNVYAYSTTDKTPVYFDYTGTDGVSFYIRDYDKKVGNGSSSNNLPNSNYFKVQDSKIYCDAPLSNTDVVTWILEPVGTSGDDDDDEGGNDNIVGEEQEVTIGGDVNSNNTSSGLPINAYYRYTFSQQIYTQSEIGTGAGTITKLAFKKQTDRNANRKIKVYMQNTSKASFASNTDWVSMTDADKVFEGEVNLSGENNDLELTLNTPFSYTGENLLISVCDYTGTDVTSTHFYTYSTSEARSIFVRSDGTSYDPSDMSSIQGNLTYLNNIIDITIETVLSSDVPSSPENLVATVQGTTSIALSWDAVDGATSYNVYGNSSVNPIVNVATGTSYTDTNLTPATNYCYTVSAVNTNGESEASEPACATTEADNTGGDDLNGEEHLVVIGGDTQYSLNELPITTYYNYGYSQQIYTKDEIGINSGTITKIAFKQSNEVKYTRSNVVVYMQNTTKASYTSGSDWVNVTEDTKVFEGSLTTPGTNGNLEITLNTPFKYTGGNLLISICDNTGSCNDKSFFYIYDSGPYRSIYVTNDKNPYTPSNMNGSVSGKREGYNNYIEITIMTAGSSTPEPEPEPEEPTVPDTPSEFSGEVSIGYPTTLNNKYMPLYAYYEYNYSQQIYTKAEIDPNGTANGSMITKIAFKHADDIRTTRKIEVYVQNVTDDRFKSASSWIAISDANKVFDGDVSIAGKDEDVVIEFNEPLQYTGNNLLISVFDKTGGYINYPPTFYTYAVDDRSVHCYDIQAFDPKNIGTRSGEMESVNNSIVITFEAPSVPDGIEFSGSGDWNDASKWSTNALPDENSNVSVSGDVIINGDVTVKTLVINDGGSVTVESGKLTVTDGMTNNDASAFIINDGAQVVQGNDDVKATFLMNVEAPESWTEDHSNGWQFIASPMKDFSSSEFETEGIDYDLFKYDGTQELQWVNYKIHGTDFEAKLQQGRGYLASYATKSDVAFEGTLNNERSYTFSDFRAYDESDHYANFYLLGNPFTFNIEWNNMICDGIYSGGFATVDEDGSISYAGQDADVAVGDGFMVYVDGSSDQASLSYSIEQVRNRRHHADEKASLNIIASNKKYGDDNVVINFSENDKGFAKFENFNKDIAEIYVKNDGRPCGILGFDKDTEEIELCFDAKQMGEYTINAITNGDFQSVILVDRFTANETELLTGSYTFTSATNENSERFTLRIKHEKENENFVYQSGSELVIDAEGLVQVMDVMGRIVYSGEQNGVNRVDIGGMNSSTYIIRNVNNNEVRIQKIVVF